MTSVTAILPPGLRASLSRILPALLLASLLGSGAAAGDDTQPRRIDDLVTRWRDGDGAARAGVVAELKALGDWAIDALFARLTAPRDFAATDPGVVMPEATAAQETGTAVLLEVKFREASDLAPGADGPARLLTGKEEAALQGKVKFLSAPRLTIYDGQRANVSVLRQVEYVRTYDEGKRPVTGTVNTGLVLDARPIVSKDKKFVTFVLRVVRAEVREPIATVQTAAGEIGVPDVMKREVAITLHLADDGRATIALPAAEGFKPLLLTLHGKVVERDRSEAAGPRRTR